VSAGRKRRADLENPLGNCFDEFLEVADIRPDAETLPVVGLVPLVGVRTRGDTARESVLRDRFVRRQVNDPRILFTVGRQKSCFRAYRLRRNALNTIRPVMFPPAPLFVQSPYAEGWGLVELRIHAPSRLKH
jgi:hypothetical protein